MKVLTLLLLLAAAPAAWAQSIFGEIRGTVTDATGAVIAGAKATAKNTATSETRIVESDEAGNYAFLNLNAGPYEVTIERSGFRTTALKGITVRARDIARADAKIEVASTTTEVQVTEVRQVIQTDMATIVDSKTTEQLNALPVNFRAGSTNSVFSLIANVPGVQPDSGGGQLSLAGGAPFQVTASIDGISSINVRGNGIIQEMFPSADAIAEIKVSSVSNNAEFAQMGDVTTTSRGGSNAFHGAAFWYHQNGAFDARDFFSTRQGAPFKVSNDFGGNVGGPIKRNKTFFFFAEESLRYRAQGILNITVPPDAYRTGDLSSVTAPVLDPLNNRTPFSGNIIPSNRISPVSAKALELLYPRANVAGTNISNVNLLQQLPVTTDNNQYDVRGDHVFSSKQSIFGRFSWKRATRSDPLSLSTLGQSRTITNARTLAAAHNYIVSPAMVNEFRAGFSDRPFVSTFGPGGADFDGPSIVKAMGINGLRSDPPKVASSPDIGFSGAPFAGTGKSRGYGQGSRTIQFTDSLTWTKGRHTMKFGADLRKLTTSDNVSFFSGDDLGEYRFTNRYSNNAFGDFLLGYPFRTRVANTGPDIDGGTFHQAYYGQDDWKVTSKLTLNFGLRWEVHPPFRDNTLQLANFERDFPGGRVVVPNEASLALTAPGFRAAIGSTPIVTAATAGLPENLRYTDKNNFMPRFGFAYRPWDNRTVIRGGYGIYSVTILGAVFYSLVGIHTSDTRTFDGVANTSTPDLTFQNPFRGGLGTVSAVGTADFRRGNQIDAPDPYAQQWNITIERDLGWNTGIRVTYQGSHSLKLFASPDLNQVPVNTLGYNPAARATRPYPNWAIVYSRDTGPSAKYNALLTELSKRAGNGLSFQTSYAWSRNLSNATGSNSTGFAAENGSVPTDRFNLGLDYGNVSATRRHRWLTTATYALPYGRGAVGTGAERLAHLAFGGWELSGILVAQSGQFLTPTVDGSFDPSGTNVDSRANNRPDYTGTSRGNLPADQRTINQWFDRTAFVQIRSNTAGRFGNVGPGQLVGPGTTVLSAKLQKKFVIVEGKTLQLEGSFINLPNHANFGIPQMSFSNANFGRITSTQGAEGAGSRSIQVGMRFAF